METEFLERLTEYPEIINITTQRSNNGLICYRENIEKKIIESVIWVYKNYFLKDLVVFTSTLFNDFENAIICNLEVLEKFVPKKNEIIIFALADFIFMDFNKKRLNTLLKSILKKNKIIIFSSFSLKCMNLPVLEFFDFYLLKNRPRVNYSTLLDNISFFDLVTSNQEEEEYEQNLESFIEMVENFVNDKKKIYISMDLSTNRLLEIEKLFKDKGIEIGRCENMDLQIVINSYKSFSKNILQNNYEIYIFVPSVFEESIQLVSMCKDIFTNRNVEIFVDSGRNKNIQKCLKDISDQLEHIKVVIKDSCDFDTYSDLIKSTKENLVSASEKYYLFQSPESILKMDLGGLTKKNYDTIRNFVKTRLNVKYDIEVKTCQLSSPCSPRDRSRKLNSLSNKISSFNYRCECTCEIFKDYSIGVILWTELFSNGSPLNLSLLKNNTYVYQTTTGKWKYTNVY